MCAIAQNRKRPCPRRPPRARRRGQGPVCEARTRAAIPLNDLVLRAAGNRRSRGGRVCRFRLVPSAHRRGGWRTNACVGRRLSDLLAKMPTTRAGASCGAHGRRGHNEGVARPLAKARIGAANVHGGDLGDMRPNSAGHKAWIPMLCCPHHWSGSTRTGPARPRSPHLGEPDHAHCAARYLLERLGERRKVAVVRDQHGLAL